MRRTLQALLILLTFAVSVAAQAPHVNKLVDLKYPPMARAAGINGQVVLDVKLSPDGTVTSIDSVSGHPLLREPSRQTILQWVFEPSVRREPRSVRLYVDFGDVSECKDCPDGTQLRYDGIDYIHVTYILSIVHRLPRENGEIVARYCPVHHELMNVEPLPIQYGLATVLLNDGSPAIAAIRDLQNAFESAQKADFPNANESIEGGCLVDIEKWAEIEYCESCRISKAHWLALHPDFDPNESPVEE